MVPQKDIPVLNSRKERLKRTPVPWIILFILTIAFWGSFVIPKYAEWQQIVRENESLELQIKSLQLSTQVKSLKLEKKEAEFDLVAGPSLRREKQLFPKKVEKGKIVKILELYTLQLENLDSAYEDSRFKLTQISFGKPQRAEKEHYSSTSFSLSFTCDRKNLQDFIQFLQTGELSERFKTGKENGQIELVDYKFLENNGLPLINIESIQKSFNKKDNIISVRLSGNIFSQ